MNRDRSAQESLIDAYSGKQRNVLAENALWRSDVGFDTKMFWDQRLWPLLPSDKHGAQEVIEALEVWAKEVQPALLALRRREYQRVLDEMNSASLDPIIFKGESLPQLHWQAIGPPAADVDLLVAPGRVLETKTLLAKLGFSQVRHVRRGRLWAVHSEAVSTLEATPWYFGQMYQHSVLVPVPELRSVPPEILRLCRSIAPTSRDIYYGVALDVHYSINHLTDYPAESQATSNDWGSMTDSTEIFGRHQQRISITNQFWLNALRTYMDAALFSEFKWRAIADNLAMWRLGLVDCGALELTVSQFPRYTMPLFWYFRFMEERFGLVLPLDFELMAHRHPPQKGSNFGPLNNYVK